MDTTPCITARARAAFNSSVRKICPERFALFFSQSGIDLQVRQVHSGSDRYKTLRVEFQILNRTQPAAAALPFIEGRRNARIILKSHVNVVRELPPPL